MSGPGSKSPSRASPEIADAAVRAFAEHRAALTGHCYRMLGSVSEADDAVQETLVRAWRGLDHFEGRAALRTWLYTIATRVCLDLIGERSRRLRPIELGTAGTIAGPLTTRPAAEWIEPIPDADALPDDATPEQLVELRQSIRLAFVAALQHLPPKQRAALLMAEVLGWPASEIAESLETTVPAINSALQRARATLAEKNRERAAALNAAHAGVDAGIGSASALDAAGGSASAAAIGAAASERASSSERGGAARGAASRSRAFSPSHPSPSASAASGAAARPSAAHASLTPEQQTLVDRYMAAFERYDVDALTALLHEDATLSMPPYELWLTRHDVLKAWLLGPGAPCRGSKLIPTFASGSPAFGQYRPSGPGGRHEPWALIVLELDGDRIAGMNSFLDTRTLFPRFGLPAVPPGEA